MTSKRLGGRCSPVVAECYPGGNSGDIRGGFGLRDRKSG
jgi:hypothetical protein